MDGVIEEATREREGVWVRILPAAKHAILHEKMQDLPMSLTWE